MPGKFKYDPAFSDLRAYAAALFLHKEFCNIQAQARAALTARFISTVGTIKDMRNINILR